MQNCQMTQSPKRTSLWANGLIWFGAALSIAEIQTGTFLAPLGFGQGMLAIFMGHLIGCALLCEEISSNVRLRLLAEGASKCAKKSPCQTLGKVIFLSHICQSTLGCLEHFVLFKCTRPWFRALDQAAICEGLHCLDNVITSCA